MREYELEILNQYDIEIISTRKVRGAFFCETNEGLILLKEAGISDGRALLLYQLLRQLSRSGYENVDLPVFTKEQELISTSRDGTRYMLKHWFGGRECDVRREGDVLEAVRNLSLLHQRCAGNRIRKVTLQIRQREKLCVKTGRRQQKT